MSHELKEGTQLSKVISLPAENGEQAIYLVGDNRYCVTCKSITVVDQNGQMAPVPWAKAVCTDGEVVLINLANVESVTLARSREAG